jgi:phosphoesterase RecJ-like protein
MLRVNPAILDLLTGESRFLLAGHERPDGDCIGAQVALYHLLEALGKQVAIVNPDPPAPVFEFLLEATPIQAYRSAQELPPFDVLVLLDCAHLSRLGRMREAVEGRAGSVLVLDHHVGSEAGDGDLALVDSTAPATGALVRDLYRALDVEMSPAAAEGVFVSLIADTGWFRYSNTTAEVLKLAGELVDSGVDPSSTYDRIHRTNHPDSVAFLADALGRGRFALDDRFGWIALDKEAVDRAGRIGFDLDLVMEPLRSVKGVEVVALIKENGVRNVKVSLRASGDVDVQAIAAGFGGGGHKKAAGFSLSASLNETLDAVQARVGAALAARDGVAR